jgi:hypothetical protein
MTETRDKALDDYQRRVDEMYAKRVRVIRTRPLYWVGVRGSGLGMWCCGALVGFALGWFGCMLLNGVPL